MSNTNLKMRVIHRYLGYFLAGIMTVYALSGIVLIYRNTDFLKQEYQRNKTVEANTPVAALGEILHIKRFKIEREQPPLYYFKNGVYNSDTGEVSYTVKKLPLLLNKMNRLHKSKTGQPLYFLNIFFGLALLFFVISSFWMFMPKMPIFKKGMYFVGAGMLLTILLLFL